MVFFFHCRSFSGYLRLGGRGFAKCSRQDETFSRSFQRPLYRCLFVVALCSLVVSVVSRRDWEIFGGGGGKAVAVRNVAVVPRNMT